MQTLETLTMNPVKIANKVAKSFGVNNYSKQTQTEKENFTNIKKLNYS